MYKAATVLSALMKVYTIPCHDRGDINVMLVLQSCRDPLRVLPSSSIETFPSSSDGTYDVGNVKVEEDVDVIGEIFTAVNNEIDIGIKQEEIPEDIIFPEIKSEPDEVSCVCMYVCY
jgi:alpha-D-ribose 1-methylphosphonate 5-phosphate C-P lyase